jgi:hypothetical protein
MEKLIKLTKLIQALLLVAFLLPFTPESCSTPKHNIISENSTQGDPANQKQAQKLKAKKYSETPVSERIIATVPVLKPVIRPNNNFSGIGYMLDNYSFFTNFSAIYLSFFVTLLGLLVLLLRDMHNRMVFTVLSLTGFLSLLVFNSDQSLGTPLWGYDVALSLYLIQAILALYIYMKGQLLAKRMRDEAED